MPVRFSGCWGIDDLVDSSGDAADINSLLGVVRTKRRVLVIGEVQAGKTSVYTKLINALRVSDPNALTIVLTSADKKLQAQTKDRLRDTGAQCFMKTEKGLKEAKKVLDEKRRQNNLSFVMVVDDEADAASPNTSAARNTNTGSNDASTIHRYVASLADAAIGEDCVPLGCYVAVTATPAAVLLATRGTPLSPEVAYLLQSHKEYYSLKDAMGTALTFPSQQADDLKSMCIDALSYYLVACVLMRRESPNEQDPDVFPDVPQLMIHSSRGTKHHDETKKEITAVVGELYSSLVRTTSLRELTDSLPGYERSLRQAAEQFGVPLDESMLLGMRPVLHELTKAGAIHVVNSKTKPKTPLDQSHTPRCVIGGAMLSRGITLQGLVTAAFFRETTDNTPLDTVAQWARFCGPRKKYEKYCRVILTQQTKISFEDADEQLRRLNECLGSVARDRVVDLNEWDRQFFGNAKTVTRTNVQGIRLSERRLLCGWNTFQCFSYDTDLVKIQMESFDRLVESLGLSRLQQTDTPHRLSDSDVSTFFGFLREVSNGATNYPFLGQLASLLSEEKILDRKSPVYIYMPGPFLQKRSVIWESDERGYGRVNNLFSGAGSTGSSAEHQLLEGESISIHLRRVQPIKDGNLILDEALFQVMGAIHYPFTDGGEVMSLEQR